jgi:hypothetical protein
VNQAPDCEERQANEERNESRRCGLVSSLKGDGNCLSPAIPSQDGNRDLVAGLAWPLQEPEMVARMDGAPIQLEKSIARS